MKETPIPDHPKRLSRRRFLGGTAAAVVAAGSVKSQTAQRADNPFEYNVDRFMKVDPALLHYALVREFQCPRPDPRRMAMLGSKLLVAAHRHVCILESDGTLSSELSFSEPVRCVASSPEGEIYVGLRRHLEVFDANLEPAARWDPLGDRAFLTGLAIGSAGVFVADSGNRVVHRFDPTGKAVGQIGKKDSDRGIPGLLMPSPYLDVELGAGNLVWVNNPGRHRVEVYTLDGGLELTWGKPSFAVTGFCGCCNPVGIALTKDGRCVTFEKGIPRVKIYSAWGEFECVVAEPESFVDVSKEKPTMDVSGPSGADGVVAEDGTIYIVDTVSGRIQVREPKSQPTASATSTPAPAV